MKLNKYFPFAVIYFFINSLALPFGLTYTTLLAPFFYIWIIQVRKKEILLPFIAILLPFIIAHLSAGVDSKIYAISFVNLLLVYIFCQAVYTFLKVCRDPAWIFRKLLIMNFIFCLVALAVYFTPFYKWLWVEQNISTGLDQFRRLKLLTYEPSYYALLFTPVFFFYWLQYLLRQNTISSGWLLLMLFLPYVLSFSIGVISAAFLAGLLTHTIWFRRLTPQRRILNTIFNTGAILVSVLMFFVLFFRDNPVFSRLGNIFSGRDSSGKGRTIDAFILAGKLLRMKDGNWGVGIGQIKIIGNDIIREYYLYNSDYIAVIPNAAAETLAIFGWVGLSLRILIEVFLFFYSRVWINYYRLSLFFFIFIYQFTGSFITNGAEYVIWILAFTNVFDQFDVKADERKGNSITLLPQQQV